MGEVTLREVIKCAKKGRRLWRREETGNELSGHGGASGLRRGAG